MALRKAYLSLLICCCMIYLFSCNKSVNPTIDVTSKYISFDQFQTQYQKKYTTTAETSIRKLAYETNLKKLAAENCTACGVTEMFDKTEKQLSMLNGVNLMNMKFTDPQNLRSIQSVSVKAGKSSSSQPTAVTSLDWRTSNVLTAIKDQGSCGSCWAFATVAFFESWMIRNKGQAVSIDMAEQELLECDTQSSGCNGGNSVSASNYALKNGLAAESSQTYKAAIVYNNLCGGMNQYTFPSTVTFQSYFNSRRMDDATIISLLTVQPLTIYLTASTWYMYKPVVGVSEIFKCTLNDSTKYQNMNHAVLLVGYGTDYWLVRNSWGTSFGLGGYIKISRNVKENCGIGFFVGYV